MSINNKISIFDTTLRDGEQAPGSALSLEKKIEFARQLSRLNVDVIEVGFPVASTTDFIAVQEISSEIKDSTICAFARSVEKDILSASKALGASTNSRIQIVTPISDRHLATRLKMGRKDGLQLIRDSIKLASSLAHEVAFIGEDSSRADPEYRLQCFEVAAESGAKFLTYADTVGYSTPEDIHTDIHNLVKILKSEGVSIGIHCHNDLGLAVANSLSAILAGANEVQCTINGVGERAGNTALEEIVMALYVREDHYKVKTDIDTRLLTITSGLLSQYTGTEIPNDKAVVGQNAFAHCSGMHQHGMIMHPKNYEIMMPSTVGADSREFIIGRHSGKHGVSHVLSEMGYKVKDKVIIKVLKEIKNSLGEAEYIDKEHLAKIYERLLVIEV